MKESTKKLFDGFFAERKELSALRPNMERATAALCAAAGKNQILACGNGGSAADAEHIAGELMKSFVLKRETPADFREKLRALYGDEGNFIADNIQGGVPCIPLTSFCALNTAFLNDCNEKFLFAQQVNALGKKGDVLIAISTSGNSRNVCYAAQVARARGMTVIALTGSGGGKLKALSDVLLNVPSDVTYKIQELHLPIYHAICLAVENEIFGR